MNMLNFMSPYPSQSAKIKVKGQKGAEAWIAF